MKVTATPWTSTATVLRNAHGESIASGGNNRRVVGAELANSLRLAAAAPELATALNDLVAMIDHMGLIVPGMAEARAVLNSLKGA
jgi:hypothetical protein